MSDLFFSPDHTWVRRDGDGATIGISDHAQETLGPLVNVDLPPIDSTVVGGSACGLVESMKTASDIIAPVTGKVIAWNEAVLDDPSLVNRAAEGDGWLFRLAIADNESMSTLIARDVYMAGI
jgi:glycine cleavage system H protein